MLESPNLRSFCKKIEPKFDLYKQRLSELDSDISALAKFLSNYPTPEDIQITVPNLGELGWNRANDFYYVTETGEYEVVDLPLSLKLKLFPFLPKLVDEIVGFMERKTSDVEYILSYVRKEETLSVN